MTLAIQSKLILDVMNRFLRSQTKFKNLFESSTHFASLIMTIYCETAVFKKIALSLFPAILSILKGPVCA